MDPAAVTSAASRPPVNNLRSSSDAPSQSSRVRKNLSYLITHDTSARPDRLHTRAFLSSLRYISVFVFWRLVRVAKYAVVGSLVAAVAGTTLGPLIGAAGFLVAPPGILAFAGVGLLWGFAKFGFRTMRWRIKRGQQARSSARDDERVDAMDTK